MECYQSSSAAGTPLALKVFISGRGRLENEGSKALSEVFKVCVLVLPDKFSDHKNVSCYHLKFQTKSSFVREISPKCADGMTNSVYPVQTAPLGAV